MVAYGGLSRKGGEQAMAKLLERKMSFTAVLCSNDESAFGAMRSLQAARISIPSDVSVVGHDDVSGTTLVTPALTTVRVPQHELGRTSIQCLSDRAENPERPPHQVLISERLIVRDSVRNLNGPNLQPANTEVMP